jgi:hypothetical protein
MHSRLQAFMFRLGRDHLPGGVIESLVQDTEKVSPNEKFKPQGPGMTGLLENADELAHRLMPEAYDAVDSEERQLLEAIESVLASPYVGNIGASADDRLQRAERLTKISSLVNEHLRKARR